MSKKQKRINAQNRNDKQLSIDDLVKKWQSPEYKKIKAERRARSQAKSCFIS